VSTQTPSHSVVGDAHAQAPAAQTVPPVHAIPQAPQSSEFV
jgi:hypothetical protein